jgi:hypothetical protein
VVTAERAREPPKEETVIKIVDIASLTGRAPVARVRGAAGTTHHPDWNRRARQLAALNMLRDALAAGVFSRDAALARFLGELGGAISTPRGGRGGPLGRIAGALAVPGGGRADRLDVFGFHAATGARNRRHAPQMDPWNPPRTRGSLVDPLGLVSVGRSANENRGPWYHLDQRPHNENPTPIKPLPGGGAAGGGPDAGPPDAGPPDAGRGDSGRGGAGPDDGGPGGAGTPEGTPWSSLDPSEQGEILDQASEGNVFTYEDSDGTWIVYNGEWVRIDDPVVERFLGDRRAQRAWDRERERARLPEPFGGDQPGDPDAGPASAEFVAALGRLLPHNTWGGGIRNPNPGARPGGSAAPIGPQLRLRGLADEPGRGQGVPYFVRGGRVTYGPGARPWGTIK